MDFLHSFCYQMWQIVPSCLEAYLRSCCKQH
uniref:Uncharacterized protein n=1 Tax=Rhizophora mucronata TaxID=61149 RepID=A0A2P2K459_RHIMU